VPHKRPPSTAQIADDIRKAEDAHFAKDRAGRLHVYRSGVYRPDGEEFVRRAVKRCLERKRSRNSWSSYRADEVIAFVRVDAPYLEEKPPTEVLNLKNGLLDVGAQSHRLQPHTPDHLSTVQLAAAFDPKAKCPKWEEFVEDVFPSDAVSLAWEIAALLITPLTDIQKAILLLGEGGNGKSTFLAGLTKFLGPTNVSGVSLHRLGADRFAGAQLYGKLANICADLPSGHLKDTAIFKSITGGDSLPVEEKFRPSFDYIPFARLLFSANRPPNTCDPSEAFFDRWIVLPFEGKFRGRKGEVPRSTLDRRLGEPGELSGLLNKALDALPGVRSRGITATESTRAALGEFRRLADPLSWWLSEESLVRADAYVAKSEFYAAHCRWCVEHDNPAPTFQRFGQALKKLRPDVRDFQRGAEKTWCYQGIGLKNLPIRLHA
jgi:P4 family phage/plasmid primase-like protien